MNEETLGEKRERAVKVIRILKQTYPDATVTLDYGTPFELLVSTILAAQCTDEKVNEITPELFRRYPTPEAFANADIDELQDAIKQTGFFRQKTRALMAVSSDIILKFDGKVPYTLEGLTSLRGVGRKTANILLGAVFGKQAVAVDTHVKRLAARLGFTDNEDPTKIEFDLMKVIPKDSWTDLNHVLVAHGRAICKAPRPLCERCPALELCPFGRRRMGMG